MRPSLIAASFFAVTKFFPAWRPALWRYWYNLLAKHDVSGQLLFMNYGFAGGATEVALRPEDEPFRLPIQLYARVFQGLEVADKDVLEVGCGRGGGGRYCIRYLRPQSFKGVDLSDAAIDWCKREHAFSNAEWRVGRADSLPVADLSADIVVNVESSHSYPSMAAFLWQVKRVLRPGGYFAFCDVRMSQEVPGLERDFNASGLQIVRQERITAGVLKALDVITSLRESQIETRVPRILQRAFRDFAGVKESVLYELMRADSLQYVLYVLRKPI